MNGRKGKTGTMTKEAKRGKTGRPKKNGEKLRPFTITATPSELQFWKEAAKRDSRALSAWVRLVLNQKVVESGIEITGFVGVGAARPEPKGGGV